MLIENQKVTIKWTNRNKNWYVSKGYKFTNYNDTFVVDIMDLSYGSKIKVKAKCDYCGEPKDVQWKNYYNKYYLKNEKYACCHCKQIKISEKTLEERQQYLYDGIIKVCSEKGLILLTQKEEIKTCDTRIKYLCPIHGENDTKAYTLFLGHGCPDCMYEKAKLTPNEVYKRISDFGATLLNKEDYIDTITKNLIIICRECGSPFTTSYNSFISCNGGQYCPECTKHESLGEKKIRLFLENNKINYICQYTYNDCKDVHVLPFDFYLPDHNKLIEYDGRQHYYPSKWNSEMTDEDTVLNFNKTQKHDNIKNDYCNKNNIKLLRIPYWNFDNINDILKTYLHEDIV